MPGKESKLTPEVAEQYFGRLSKCLHMKGAALCIGVAEQTARRWYLRGKRAVAAGKETNGERIYVDFFRRTDQVVQQRLADMLAEVERQGTGPKGDANHLKWIMERIDPDTWGNMDYERRLQRLEAEARANRA
jgi:hypothetical protein